MREKSPRLWGPSCHLSVVSALRLSQVQLLCTVLVLRPATAAMKTQEESKTLRGGGKGGKRPLQPYDNYSIPKKLFAQSTKFAPGYLLVRVTVIFVGLIIDSGWQEWLYERIHK